MIDFINDLMNYKFLQHALIAGFVVSLTCSLLSSFVVLKKMAFIGQGISHTAFGGVALGLLLKDFLPNFNINISLITSIFTIGSSTLIWVFSRKKKISEDSAIGILLVTAMALGILFLGFRKSYTYDIFGYLFGNIISVGEDDVWIISITGFMIISIVIIFFKRLFYFIFDPDSASVAGLNIDFYHLLLLTLLSITIVISIKVVGIILVSAYLVISGATAQLLTKSLKKMMLISIIVGFISTFLGLFVSNSYELPSGAVIVLTMLFFFILALIINYLKKRRLQLKEQ